MSGACLEVLKPVLFVLFVKILNYLLKLCLNSLFFMLICNLDISTASQGLRASNTRNHSHLWAISSYILSSWWNTTASNHSIATCTLKSQLNSGIRNLLILEKDHICEHKIVMILAINYIFKPLNFLLYNGFDLDGNLNLIKTVQPMLVACK